MIKNDVQNLEKLQILIHNEIKEPGHETTCQSLLSWPSENGDDVKKCL